jgi:two-component system chemotaxis response regulator CheY
MKVLVVDDSKTMRNIQKGILAQLGYHEVEEAADGVDALSKARAFQPDLLLVDSHMPQMDGVAFVRAYRAQGQRAPVILVAADADREQVIEAIEAGVDHYLIKPFTPDRLGQRIKEALERDSAA